MNYGKNHMLLGNARSLRKNMTTEERHLWYDFLRYCQPRFRRQEIISNYIIDFFAIKPELPLSWMARSIVSHKPLPTTTKELPTCNRLASH